MKKTNSTFRAITILLIVSGSLAFKSYSDGRVYVCVDDVCRPLPGLYNFPGSIIIENATTNPNCHGKPCTACCDQTLHLEEESGLLE